MPQDEWSVLGRIAIWALPVILAITVHEVAHGWVAYKLGDDTAKKQGRLTLNPISHIDLVGTIILPTVLLVFGGFMFGWAKPVPVNFRNLNKPKRDMVYVAIAGPLANLIMIFCWAILMKLAMIIGHSNEFISLPLIYMAYAGIFINAVLMVLNLLPILPLDGGRVVAGLLPHKMSVQFSRLEPLGLPILIGIMVMNWLPKLIGPPIYMLQTSIFRILGI
ncbi:MAG: site-2 protease family protein [Cycloclasticus sp.]|nr:site-2 protease family protein [Cycloclasticus sp.]